MSPEALCCLSRDREAQACLKWVLASEPSRTSSATPPLALGGRWARRLWGETLFSHLGFALP